MGRRFRGRLLVITASVASFALVGLHIGSLHTLANQGKSFTFGGLRSFEIVPLKTVSETSSNASIGDLNGDGCPDILLVKGRHWPLKSLIFLGDCKGHFTPGPPLPGQAMKSYSGSLADMTKSGHLDIVYACRDSCQSLIYFNDGKGNFTRREPWGPPHSSTRALALADFNGDGHLDIAACHEQLGCFVYLNDGKGNFGNGIEFQRPGAEPYSMLAADLNKDGRPEILVGYVNAPGTIYFNDGSGKKFRPMPFGDGKGAIYGMAAGDLNGDGWPDVVVARSDAPSFVMFNRPFRGQPLSKPADSIPQSTELQPTIATAPSVLRVKRVSVHYHNFDDATLPSLSRLMMDEIKFIQVDAPYDAAKANQMKSEIEEFWKAHGIVVRVDLTVVPFPGRPQLLDVKFDVFKQ
jgi:hypothetical protein